MTLAYDSDGPLSEGGSDFTPVGTARALLFFILANGASTDTVNGVTIEAVSMTEVPLSPLIFTASSEDAVLYCYFLGDSIPTGPLTIDIDGTPTGGWIVAFTASGDCEVLDTTVASTTSGANPAVTVEGDTVSGAYGLGLLQSGLGTTSQLTPNAGNTQLYEDDFGAQLGSLIRTTALSTSDPITLAWTAVASSYALLGVSIREIAGAPVVSGLGHGRAHSRATSTAAVTEIARAHGRAHSRAKAFGDTPSIPGAGRGRGRGRSRAIAAATTVTSASRSRGRGRSMAIIGQLVSAAIHNRGRGRSALFGDVAGIQYVEIPAVTPWLDMAMPTPPTQQVILGVGRSRRPVSQLGRVAHMVVGPSGESANPVVGQWFCEDDMFGGFGSAGGVIDDKEFRRHPEVYQQEAVWRTYHVESGECIWAGKLSQPDLQSGGVVSLVGRGWGQKLLNRTIDESIVYAHYGSEGWVDGNSDLIQTGGGPTQFDLSFTGGSITFERQADSDRTLPAGGQSTQAMFVRLGANLSRFTFTLDANQNVATGSPAGDANFRLEVWSGRAERSGESATAGLWRNYNQVHVVTPTLGAFVLPVDIDLMVDDGVPITLFPPEHVLVIVSSQFTGIQKGLSIKLRSLVVLGESLQSNDMTAGQLVADICNRLGFSTDYIENSGPDILPFEVEPGTTWGETLSFVALLSRKRFVMRGERPLPYFSAPKHRLWFVTDEHHEPDLVPAERFDTILVPYTLFTDSRISGYRKVVLENSPLERRNSFGALEWPFPIRSIYGEFGSIIEDQRAEDLGIAILDVLSQNRRTGSGTLSEVIDQNGTRQSARLIQAGDRLRYTYGEFRGQLSVTKVRQSDTSVDLEFDNPVAHYLERAQAMRQLKHDSRMRRR